MNRTPCRGNRCLRAAACVALSFLLAGGTPGTARAQDTYPSRTITVVVPFPAGSGSDMSARLLAKDMAESLRQTVVVENRPGADGSLGTQAVARARPDGYTLLVGVAATHAANYAFYPGKLGYEPSSFDIVGGLGMVPLSMFVAANAPWTSLADLIADAKRQPGKIVCGSGTTVAQMACEVFKLRAGVDLLNVPYKGSPNALNDLMGGHVQVVFADGASAAAHVEQKRLRVLATAAGKRLPYWPDVPTFVELGMTDLEISAWSAVFVPAGTPAAVRQKLSDAVRRAADAPEAVASRQRTGGLALVLSQEEGRRFIDAEISRWARLVKESGVKPQ
jgi:tripartite-type tricarboxylate transporter receptor subunit TctC